MSNNKKKPGRKISMFPQVNCTPFLELSKFITICSVKGHMAFLKSKIITAIMCSRSR